MERLCVLCVLVCVSLGVTQGAIVTRQTEEDAAACEYYGYCEGDSFERRMVIMDRAISCQEGVTNATLKQSCCLPQEFHLVCYNIKVEGDWLNFSKDTVNNLSSTDFSELCRYMVEAAGRQPGRYNAVTIEDEGGAKAFIYGKWLEVDPGSNHIGHLACGVEN